MQNIPGVFDRTGGDLHLNGARFGFCFDIFRKRRLLHARIEEVVSSEKLVVLGVVL